MFVLKLSCTTVYSKTTPRSTMAMVIRIELMIFDQIVTSVSFGPKIGNLPEIWNFEDDCVPNGSTSKVAAWGGSYLFMKYDVFRQNAFFLRNGTDMTHCINSFWTLFK